MPLIDWTIQKDILTIHLNDSKSRNAFSPAMAEEVYQVIDSQKFSGLYLTNRGDSFCAGGNLRHYATMVSKDEGLKANQRIRHILHHLGQLKVPKVVYVDGLCVGGGVELVSCFDKVLAHPSSLFGLWQRRVALTYGWGGEERLLKRLGERSLQQWLLGAETYSSYKAKDIGLVDHIALQGPAFNQAQSWIQNVLSWGKGNLPIVIDSQIKSQEAFESLWMAPEHKKILDQMK